MGILIRLGATLLAALFAWWAFPDEVLDLNYTQWMVIMAVLFVALGLERISDKIE